MRPYLKSLRGLHEDGWQSATVTISDEQTMYERAAERSNLTAGINPPIYTLSFLCRDYKGYVIRVRVM